MSDPRLTREAFIAFALQQVRGGSGISPRWLCLRDDLRKDALFTAEVEYQKWVDGELKAERDRRQMYEWKPPT